MRPRSGGGSLTNDPYNSGVFRCGVMVVNAVHVQWAGGIHPAPTGDIISALAGGFETLPYFTVTDFAKFLGLSGLHPLSTAMWYANNCSGATSSTGYSNGEAFGMGSQ